jgi:hypothetical protein
MTAAQNGKINGINNGVSSETKYKYSGPHKQTDIIM